MDLHNRKADTRAEQQAYGIGIEVRRDLLASLLTRLHVADALLLQDINGKWLVTINDLRTDIERYKAEEIKRFLGASLFQLLLPMMIGAGVDAIRPR